MAYTKTNWNENTPITVGNMNKIETGIANALDATTGGTVNGKLTVKGNTDLQGALTMGGSINYNAGNGYNNRAIQLEPGNGSDGAYIGIGAGGLTIIGSGESTQNVRATIGHGGTEKMIVASDEEIIFQPGVQNGVDSNKAATISKSGNLNLKAIATIEGTSGDICLKAKRSDTGTEVYIGVGSGGQNHGVYSMSMGKWLVYGDGTEVKFNGGSTTITQDGKLKISGNYSKNIVMGTGGSDAFIQNSASGKYLQLKDDGALRYDDKLIYHEGNFNPATKLDAGNFSINKRDLLIHGKRALVGFNTGDGDYLAINHDGDFTQGIKIYGLTRTDAIENGGKLTFFNQIGGGRMTSLINCQELQNNTGNGQMLTAHNNKIYVGNPDTSLVLESSSNPVVNVSRREYQLFHTGNFNPATKLDAGAFTVHDRDLRVHGKRALVGFNNADGNNLHLNYNRDFANGVVIQGALRTDSIEANGIMKLHNGSEAVFHEICNARNVGMYLNNNNWGIYDYQNSRSVLRYNMDGDRVEVQGKRVATWDGNNPAHYMFRYGSGLGGANGYITFSY